MVTIEQGTVDDNGAVPIPSATSSFDLNFSTSVPAKLRLNVTLPGDSSLPTSWDIPVVTQWWLDGVFNGDWQQFTGWANLDGTGGTEIPSGELYTDAMETYHLSLSTGIDGEYILRGGSDVTGKFSYTVDLSLSPCPNLHPSSSWSRHCWDWGYVICGGVGRTRDDRDHPRWGGSCTATPGRQCNCRPNGRQPAPHPNAPASNIIPDADAIRTLIVKPGRPLLPDAS